MIDQSKPRNAGSPQSKSALGPHNGFKEKAAQFARREDGSMLVLGMLLMLIMAMMGGLAVDLMRYEQRRTEIQQTLDRSVLAAAGLSQELLPEDVVADYFLKAGVSQYLNSVTTETGLNFRNVTAKASSKIQPFFTSMIGIDELETAAGSGAEQRISNVEISLVLDISGSMTGSRIGNLRPAAREFVTSVLGQSEPGRVSVSIIPYNAQVNIGRPMMDAFNVADTQDVSSCIELPGNVFNSASLSTTTELKHNMHFDPYTYTGNLLYNCPPQDGNVVTPLSDSQAELHTAINDLETGGNTSIDVGVKWGTLLLNQTANPVVQSLISDSVVSPLFGNRPLNPAVDDVIKVLVVMTDGQNTTEYRINDPYNTGQSNIWRKNSNGTISVYFDRNNTNNDWWWPRTNQWKNSRDGGNSGYTQLDWHEVWADYSVTYVAYHFYGLALNENYNNWRNVFMSSEYSQKNSRLQQICTAAKASGIVVYGIGFEAPYSGREQVRMCSTTDSHYFDASGLEISTAFRAIANNISQLKLTQ